jgi:hypothetical protein
MKRVIGSNESVLLRNTWFKGNFVFWCYIRIIRSNVRTFRFTDWYIFTFEICSLTSICFRKSQSFFFLWFYDISEKILQPINIEGLDEKKKKKSHTDLCINCCCGRNMNVKSKSIWLNGLNDFSMIISLNKKYENKR